MKIAGRLFVFVCLTAISIWAQGTTQISGTVKDASGLPVPGAEVKATQTATRAVRTATTAADGGYVFSNLPVGPYLLEITKEGFSRYVQSGIILQVDTNPRIDASLKVGAVSEQVTVQADAAMVETHNTGVGQVVDQQRVVDLPLNGREATQLILLAGATVVGNNTTNSNMNYPTITLSVAGGTSNGITFIMDGGTYNDPFNNLNLPLPFPDALQEFKVETSALPAQYGQHSAAAINAVTKSGSNEFHGDLFEFVRNGDFNARNFFAPTRDSLKRNQFGGTIGGPIRKDKIFFFVGYQGTILRSDPATSLGFVPTPAVLSGDFTTLASPACNGGRQIALSAASGFVNNRISPSLFSPVALKILQYIPTSTDPCGKIQYGVFNDQKEHLMLSRVDYQLGAKHTLFARYFLAHLEIPIQPDAATDALVTSSAGNSDQDQSAVAGDTYLINAGMVSSTPVSFNRSVTYRPNSYFSLCDLGVNMTCPDKYASVSITGGFAIGTGAAPTAPSNFAAVGFQIAEDMSLVRGAHQIGFGVNYIHTNLNGNVNLFGDGQFTFNGQTTGLGMADYFLGSASDFTQSAVGELQVRANYIGLYIQDAWKLTPRLTVNVGLRWEPFLPEYSVNGHENNFEPYWFQQGIHSSVYTNAPAGLLFPGDP